MFDITALQQSFRRLSVYPTFIPLGVYDRKCNRRTVKLFGANWYLQDFIRELDYFSQIISTYNTLYLNSTVEFNPLSITRNISNYINLTSKYCSATKERAKTYCRCSRKRGEAFKADQKARYILELIDWKTKLLLIHKNRFLLLIFKWLCCSMRLSISWIND